MNIGRFMPWNWNWRRWLPWASGSEDRVPVRVLDPPAADLPAAVAPEGDLLRVDLPGWDPAELDVRVEGGQLVVEGHHEDSWDDSREGYRRMGRSSGHFVRRTPLPAGVDPAQVAAQLEGGVLRIRAGAGHGS